MDKTLSFNENVIFTLRSLYDGCGYLQYKMGKFEEYDLYAKNKDFLISDSVITFTDTNGKLMALKPDVTLSIIKNIKEQPDCVQKVYYNENVYRISKGTRSFKEIMQVGLEAFGNIDDYNICEVLTLAAKSLKSISASCVLDISHLGLLSGIIDSFGLPFEAKNAILKCIGEKNLHEIGAICDTYGVEKEKSDKLCGVVALNGKPSEVLPALEKCLKDIADIKPIKQLNSVISAMDDEVKNILRIDFSVVSDIKYYNGIVFKGFIDGVPTGVLSGGQYDKLMQKMHRKSGAIGFAIYLDMLERLGQRQNSFDTDIVLLYDSTAQLDTLMECAAALRKDGESVTVQRAVPENLKYRKLLKFCNGEVKILENNA